MSRPALEVLARRAAVTPRLPVAASLRSFSTTPVTRADFAHTVVGAGVVGLAVARALQIRAPDEPVLLIERHGQPGTETSSRNSEVIHAGLYYGHGSLKTKLCLRGKTLMYSYCESKGVAARRVTKWLVAQNDAQREALARVEAFAEEVGDGTTRGNGLGTDEYPRGFRGDGLVDEEHAIPLRQLSAAETARREPDVRCEAGALESASTGIVDSHSLMTALLGDFEDAGGTTAFATDLLSARRDEGADEWEMWTAPARLGQLSVPGTVADPASVPGASSMRTTTMVNCAGLGAIPLSNALLPPSEHRKPAYAKGTYYSYGASSPRPGVLVYPAPQPGHGGLGTHLTLDLGGRVRFGPDVEWIERPDDLAPNGDPARFEAALDDIKSYMPGLQRDAVALDYCGIRPKLNRGGSATAGPNFEDFYIVKEKSVGGLVNLLGIESPGLTSSLAIGNYVRDILY